MEDCTSFGRLGADRSMCAAQVRQVAQSWPASGASRKLQAQSVSRWGVNQTAAEASLGRPTSTISQSPSRQSFCGSHRRGATFEAALSALGEGNPHAKPLVEALRVARAKAKVLLLEEQIVASQNFVERARKRVTRVEAVISRALEQKVVFETEVQEGEARLQQAASVTELQRRIDDLTRERDSLRAATPRVLPGVWMADGPPVVESIPPIPMSSEQDIEGWLSNRNCELRNALECGDSATVARVGALVVQGSAQLASLVQGMQPVGDGQARSCLMVALIDQADAKRRCVEVVPSTLGNQV